MPFEENLTHYYILFQKSRVKFKKINPIFQKSLDKHLP